MAAGTMEQERMVSTWHALSRSGGWVGGAGSGPPGPAQGLYEGFPWRKHAAGRMTGDGGFQS